MVLSSLLRSDGYTAAFLATVPEIRMPVYADVNEEFTVGDAWFASPAPSGDWAVVFEDDGDTGYFYAVKYNSDEGFGAVMDALHVYNVTQVTDRDRPSRAILGWSESGTAGVLLINNHAHAIFDMANKRATNRTGFPPPSATSYFKRSADWDETLEAIFR